MAVRMCSTPLFILQVLLHYLDVGMDLKPRPMQSVSAGVVPTVYACVDLCPLG